MKTFARILLVFVSTWIIARSALYCLPGDPAEYLSHETLVEISPDTLRDRMELDQSWVKRVFSVPKAQSLIHGKEVFPIIRDAFYRSLALTGLTLIFFFFFSSMLLLGAYRSNHLKKIAEWFSLSVASIPVFILGPILLYLLSLKLGLFPVTHSPWLPALTLSLYLTGFWYRTLSKKIQRYRPHSALSGAQARGIPENQAFFRYLLIPSLGDYFGFLGSQIGTLLNGSVLIEVIFQWNGLGFLLTDAVLSRDYPVVEGALLLIALITLTCLQAGYWFQSKWEEKLS